MKIFEYINQFISEPKNILKGLLNRFGQNLNDKTFICIKYYLEIGRVLNLENPKTFNEKLNWMKLYDRNPLYTKLVDKYAVKEFVSNVIGEQYVIPTLGVWDNPKQIDWTSLPEQFVLKTTHGGGGDGVEICRDLKNFDKNKAIKKLSKAMKTCPYKRIKEWPYKNVPHRIIAEEFIEDEKTNELIDYKFFCFDGEVKAMFVASERQKTNEEVKFDYFDSDFNHLDIRQHHPMSREKIKRPETFELMKEIASKLSQGIPQVRCDLYEVNGHVYFGEMTFFHHGGIVPFHPESWDHIFGSWIQLPHKE